MQPYKDHTAQTKPLAVSSSSNSSGSNNSGEPDTYLIMPPRYVHHDATMFKPIPQNFSGSSSSTTENGVASSGAAGSALGKSSSSSNKKFLSDNSKRRQVEEIQRTIELTDRLQRDAESTVLASKIAIGMESVSLCVCAFLVNFGLRSSNPQQSLLRRWADTNIRLARFGSFYTLVGMGGMAMSLTYMPMEWQAIENANMSLQKLQDSQQRAIKQRNSMLDEMAKAVGITDLPLDDTVF
jgi:hypothetical protein